MFETGIPRMGVQIGELAGNECQTPLGLIDEGLTARNRIRIAVDADDGCAGLQQRAAVAACPEGPVDNHLAGFRIEIFQNLFQENRHMTHRSAGIRSRASFAQRHHAGPPGKGVGATCPDSIASARFWASARCSRNFSGSQI